jgi:3-deoxy-manno-octulosonate cytidylyltransferase (CMP-KDO synthetase)
MKVAAVIPARMHSTRLPGKPLLRIAGVPMIVRVLERAQACSELDRIIVATDDENIRRTIEEHGGEAWMTSPHHRSGSDRVAEVAAGLSEELILNLQGDEPLLPASTVQMLVQFALGCRDLTMVTAKVPLRRERDIANPNIVKVVTDRSGKALYFSRYPVPYRKSAPLNLNSAVSSRQLLAGYFKHVGIYLYRREFLLKFVNLEPTPLEISESLEQLRILENGFPIYVVQVEEDSISVDTAEDITEVEALILQRDVNR